MSRGFRSLLVWRMTTILSVALTLLYVNLRIAYDLRSGALQGGSGNELGRHLGAILISGIVLFVFGLWRGTAFHPAGNRPYRQWLECSPWDHRHPLPLGPATLRWGDWLVIVLAAICVILDARSNSFLRPFSAYAAVFVGCCFTLGCLFATGFELMACGQSPHLVALVLAAPLFLLVPGPYPKLLVLLGLLIVADFGIRSSLKRFPWPRRAPSVRVSQLGWPFDRLGPNPVKPLFSNWRGVAVGLVAGWWTFAIASFRNGFRPLTHDDIAGFCFVLGMLAAVVRIGAYCFEYAPPLWPIARLRTGNLLIPRYDYVFLAPLAIFAIGWSLPALFQLAGIPPVLSQATTTAITIAAALQLGPSLPKWRLTGAHRMAALMSQTADRRPLLAGGS